MNKYLIAAVVTLLVVLGLYRWGYHNGWSTRDAEMQAQIAKANEESRAKEQATAEKLAQTSSQLLEANNAIDQKQSALDRAIRAGRVRLPAPSCVQASTDTAPAAGNSAEATSESDRETLRLIAQIAADGDKAINQLNACIDAYEAVRKQINGVQ